MNRAEVLGIPLDVLTLQEALEQIDRWLNGQAMRLIMTPNAEIIALAQDDEQLKRALLSADMTVADGVGVVWAARKLGCPVPERVAGIDLLEGLLERLANNKRTAYFLGGSPGVAAIAAERLTERWPGLTVVGTHHGYFKEAEEHDIIAEIEGLKPDLLVVALGAPKQENWLLRYRDRLPVKIAIGAGGSLDVFAGRVKRAPAIWQRLGLEWLYRLISDPRRLKRAWQLPRFVWLVLSAR